MKSNFEITKKRIRRLLLLTIVLASSCSLMTSESESIRQSMLRVQEIRGLDFTKSIQHKKTDLTLVGIDESQATLQGKVFQLFGLIDPLADYVALKKQFVKKGKKITYREDEKIIAVSDSLSRDEFSEEFPQGLMYALQDQNFSTGEIFKNLRYAGQSDRELALRCLTEGGALLVKYWQQHLAGEDLTHAVKENLKTDEALKNFPEVIVGPSLLMSSVHALKAVRYVVQRGGWPALNRVYRHPKISTEWFLHPEKMLTLRDVAADVRVQSLPRALKGWKAQHSDVLGEYFLRILFKKYLTERDAISSAAGWQGDRYQLYTDLSGRSVLIWKVQMDTETDLLELRIALKKIDQKISNRFPTGTYVRKFKRTSRALILVIGDPQSVDAYLKKI